MRVSGRLRPEPRAATQHACPTALGRAFVDPDFDQSWDAHARRWDFEFRPAPLMRDIHFEEFFSAADQCIDAWVQGEMLSAELAERLAMAPVMKLCMGSQSRKIVRTKVDGSVRRFHNLRVLDARWNALGKLPTWLKQLEKLHVVLLQGNAMNSAPGVLVEMESLRHLGIDRGVRLRAVRKNRPEVRIDDYAGH